MTTVRQKNNWIRYSLAGMMIVVLGCITLGCAPAQYNTKKTVVPPFAVKQNYNPLKPQSNAPGYIQSSQLKPYSPKVSQLKPVSAPNNQAKPTLADKNNKPNMAQPDKSKPQPGNNINNGYKPNNQTNPDRGIVITRTGNKP